MTQPAFPTFPKRRVHARDGGWERARARSIVVFRIFCCAAKYCCVDVAENFDGSRLTLDVQLQSKCHTCSCSSSISQIPTAQLRLQHSLYISTVTTILTDCLCALQQPNDYAFSFSRCTRFHRFGSRTLTSVRSTRHLSGMTFSSCVYRCDAAPPFNSSEVLQRQRVPSYRSSGGSVSPQRSKALHFLPDLFRVWLKIPSQHCQGPDMSRTFPCPWSPSILATSGNHVHASIYTCFCFCLLSEQGNTCQIRVCSLERRGGPHALH